MLDFYNLSCIFSCIDVLTFQTHLTLQILDWLSHSPTDIESYIRPGCIILTIYIRLEKSMWEQVQFIPYPSYFAIPETLFLYLVVLYSLVYFYIQLCWHLGTSLKRLLDTTNDPFWRTGWVYTRVQHFVAFLYNGLFSLSLCVCVHAHMDGCVYIQTQLMNCDISMYYTL